ncbi:MAG: OadG family protein [Candidatus Caldatribacteriota bacterium]|nr:OadG family protein [Candidatus Caldatribacteriota bacterium]
MFTGIKGVLQLAIIDMILVFLILGGLALVMILLKKIVGINEKKVSEEIKTIPQIKNAVPKIEKEEVEGKFIAVIASAVASYLEKPISEFKVVSIKKYTSSITTPWTAMGRQESMLRKNIPY